jgi:hypothetical protein
VSAATPARLPAQAAPGVGEAGGYPSREGQVHRPGAPAREREAIIFPDRTIRQLWPQITPGLATSGEESLDRGHAGKAGTGGGLRSGGRPR